MKITLSCIKADVGSIGGHTCPSKEMLNACESIVADAISRGVIIDGIVTYTGDDINLILSHERGPDNEEIHINLALKAFHEATRIAQQQGLYGAGQDILDDAPSGNVRGAGPAVAELTFEHDLDKEGTERAAESFLIFAADKCGPGAYNLPFYLSFADPMYCSGLLLVPKMHQGFRFTIIDMDESQHDSVIELDAPEDLYKIAALLRDNERFAIESITSRNYPEQIALNLSAQRLHNIAGTYTGKDDPIAIVRNQGIFPAPEEIMQAWTIGHFVAGGARGSHTMPIMPVPIGTPVTGPYCIPLVSALGFSMSQNGTFAHNKVDFFANPAWDYVRQKVQKKALLLRQQGWSGPAMLPYSELEYGGIKDIINDLQLKFHPRKQPQAAPYFSAPAPAKQ